MQSPGWRDKLNEFLNGQHEVRYESIRREIFYRCRFKVDGRWRRAQISFETVKILIRGEEIRRCNVC